MRPGREVSHLPPSSFVVKKERSYTFTPTISFMERIGTIITFYPYMVVHRFGGKGEAGLFCKPQKLGRHLTF